MTLGELTMVDLLKFDRIQTAGFATEDLRGMIARKRTIAQLPEARTIASRKVCGWSREDSLSNIDLGLSGGFCPLSQVSLSKMIRRAATWLYREGEAPAEPKPSSAGASLSHSNHRLVVFSLPLA